MLLTPANARRVTHQLAQLRGAAMKVGQLLSMDAGDLLPPELGDILSRLRADARPMPMSQLVTVLNANWGEGWDRHFRQFSFSPVAAASIGQVHLAQTIDGRHLAIKVQYPGVRQSIDSDIDNVASLLRISGLLPRGLDIEALFKALRADRIAGAGLDVIPVEPPVEPVPRLLAAYRDRAPWLEGRLVITPHSAFHTPEAWADIRRKSAETMRDVLMDGLATNIIPAEVD